MSFFFKKRTAQWKLPKSGKLNGAGKFFIITVIPQQRSYDLAKSQINGRFLSAKITLDDCQIVLANVYAPNDINQQVLFFKEVQKLLGKFAQETIIIGGDFNCALSPNDKEGGNPTSKKLPVILSEIDNLCHL